MPPVSPSIHSNPQRYHAPCLKLGGFFIDERAPLSYRRGMQLEHTALEHSKTHASRLISASRRLVEKRILTWTCVLLTAVAYLGNLTPGHVFSQDDFAAYVMHAENLVEGRSYTDTRYVANPDAPWLAPANGYPPVYPLLLAPIYEFKGFNLRAFKVMTVLCFAAFLAIFAELIGTETPQWVTLAALLIVGLNPLFWEYRENVLSEFPYLLFTFGALLLIQRVYPALKRDEVRLGSALLLAVLLYCAYGTRTIGIALVPALFIADVIRFRRPSRFMLAALAVTATLMLGQAAWLTSPKGYIAAEQISGQIAMRNAIYYSKTLAYFWQNGFSKGIQITFALLFTALAAAGFLRRLWAERSAREFYLLGYLAILFLWIAEFGLRALLPILPLYVAYGLGEFASITRVLRRKTRLLAMAALIALICGTYAGKAWQDSRMSPEPNVDDPAAQELFAFLRAHTRESDLLVFPKPRALALFTNRRTASLDPGGSPEHSFQFLKSVHADVLVEPVWSPPAYQNLLASGKVEASEVFHDSQYRVYQLELNRAAVLAARNDAPPRASPVSPATPLE